MRHRKEKFVVVLSREEAPAVVNNKLVEYSDEVAVVGPFNSRERADGRAAVIRREANKWEDPEGVTGPNNAIHVTVCGLARGSVSAEDALSILYGSVPAECA